MRVLAEDEALQGATAPAGHADRGTVFDRLRRGVLAFALGLYCRLKGLAMQWPRRLPEDLRWSIGFVGLAFIAILALGAALLLPEEARREAEEPPQVLNMKPVLMPPVQVAALNEPPRAPAETWQPVRRPIALYNIEAPDLDGTDRVHRVAGMGRHARQDVMSWQARPPRASPLTRPAIHLVVERFENGAPAARPLYADLAARAAEEALSIDRMAMPGEIVTKFGGMEVAETIISGDRGVLGCLAFRRLDPIGLSVTGWYCGSQTRPADRVSLGCFIDRLDLIGAGQDVPLKRHFAQAERNRKACPGARQPGRKQTWLDHEAPVPALKLSARTAR